MKKCFFSLLTTILFATAVFGQPRFSSQGHKEKVTAIAFDSLSKTPAFLTVGRDGFIIRWENGIGEHFQVSDKKIEFAAPSPNGKEIAFYESGDSYYSVKIWDVASKKTKRSIMLKSPAASLTYSAKGTYIIVTTNERNGVYFYVAATGKPFVKIKDYEMSASWAKTSESEKSLLLYSAQEGMLGYFSLKTGKPIKKIPIEGGLEQTVLFARNSLFAGYKGGSVFIFNAENGSKIKTAAAKSPLLFDEAEQLLYIDGKAKLNSLYKVQVQDKSLKGPLICKNMQSQDPITFTSALVKENKIFLGSQDGNIWTADISENSLPSDISLISNEVYQKIHSVCSDGKNIFILTDSEVIKADYDNKKIADFPNPRQWTKISCAHGKLILRSENRLDGVYCMDPASGKTELLFNAQNRIKKIREASINGQKGFLEIENSKVNFYSFDASDLSELYLGSGIQDAASLDQNMLAVAKTASSNPTSALVLVNLKTRETVPVKMDGDIAVHVEESGGFIFGSRLTSSGSGYTTSAFCLGTKAFSLKELASSANEESDAFVRAAFPLVFTNIGSKSVSVINVKNLKKYTLKSGSSLAVDIIKCQGRLATLNEDSSITWYNVEQPIPLADWYIDSKNQIVEF